MWIRIALAPLWVRALAFTYLSALWAALFVAIQWFEDGTFRPSLIAALVVGVGAAAVWSAVAVSQTRQRHGRVLAAVDLPATRSQALRAAFGGPVPTDPIVRRIAATIAAIRAQTYRERSRRQIITNSLLGALMAGLTIWMVADGSPCRALFTGILALSSCGAALQTQWACRRTTQRQVALASHPESRTPR
jgi:hypothetical protein